MSEGSGTEQSTPNQPARALSVAGKNLVAAFEYLLELNRRRRRAVFRLAEHNLPVFHEHQLLGLPGIETNLIEDDREVWIRIERLQPVYPPEPPEDLKPWVIIANDPAKAPVLREWIESGDRDETTQYIDDRPDIKEAFDRYKEEPWQDWVEAEEPRRRTIYFYDRFFSVLQDAEAGLDTDGGIEVCVGVGIAVWNHPNAASGVQYPLVVKQVELQLDSRSMALDVLPTDRDPTLSLDAFFELEITETRHVEDAARRFFESSESTLSPFDPGSFEDVLRQASSRLDVHGQYWPNEVDDARDRRLPTPEGNLRVTDTWVVFARPRSTDFIAMDVQRLKRKVEEGTPLPEAAELIVTEPPDEVVTLKKHFYRGVSNPGVGDGSTLEVRELFFPKPFNEAQVSIVERLDQSPGVVVQGPPGTGKTHTIANIICHYLALGKRILVTAQHEAPLAVLRDQIPEPLRPLAISLLTSEREGLKQLENSVRRISSEVNRLDPTVLEREIQELTARIDRLHEEISSNDHDLGRAAEPQLTEVQYMGRVIQPMELAISVARDRERYQWFTDSPDLRSDALPFTTDDVNRLRVALARAGKDLAYVDDELVDPASLPTSEQVQQLHDDLLQRKALGDSIRSGELSRLKETALKTEHLQDLARKLDTAISILQRCRANNLSRRSRNQTGSVTVGTG